LMAGAPARQITVSTRRTADMFELAIEDTGSGIAKDVLPKVFEPLFSTKSFGTGLGLPLVKQIVEQHNGTIGITSEPGTGTCVTIRLQTARRNEEIAA
jgi:signal transduction histidine kinase